MWKNVPCLYWSVHSACRDQIGLLKSILISAVPFLARSVLVWGCCWCRQGCACCCSAPESSSDWAVLPEQEPLEGAALCACPCGVSPGWVPLRGCAGLEHFHTPSQFGVVCKLWCCILAKPAAPPRAGSSVRLGSAPVPSLQPCQQSLSPSFGNHFLTSDNMWMALCIQWEFQGIFQTLINFLMKF